MIIAPTMRQLIEQGFGLDSPLIMVDPQREEERGVFETEVGYELTVVVEGQECILLNVREDRDHLVDV